MRTDLLTRGERHECYSDGPIYTDIGAFDVDDNGVVVDDYGRPVKPDVKTCWGCLRQWCDRCDPTPGALCVFCHGRGSSPAELVKRTGESFYRNGESDRV